MEKQSGRKFLAQEKPVDEELLNNIQMQNMLDAPDLAHLHQALFDKAFEKAFIFPLY